MAVGTKPNFALFRDLGVSRDSKGQVVAAHQAYVEVRSPCWK